MSRLIAIVLAVFVAAGFSFVLAGSSLPTLLASLFGYVSEHPLAFTGALAALSTLTMAVIQTAKDLVPVLRWFQRARVRNWLGRKAAEARELEAPQAIPVDFVRRRLNERTLAQRFAPELIGALTFSPVADVERLAADAEADLLRLATAGDRRAFYDLPIEQLCGQMNAAAQVILDFPYRHEALLTCLASLAIPEDRTTLASPDVRDELTSLRDVASRSAQQETRFKELNQQIADARSRITNQIHRSIDAFQISTGFRWKWYMQIVSFLVSIGIAVAAVRGGALDSWVTDLSAVKGGISVVKGISLHGNWPAIFLIGVIGGFLAPVTRDLQSIVQQLRGKS